MSDEHATSQENDGTQSDDSWLPVDLRPERSRDLPTNATNAPTDPQSKPQTGNIPSQPNTPQSAETIASLVVSHINQNITTVNEPGAIPDLNQIVALREKAPELYDAYVEIIKEEAQSNRLEQRQRYEIPEKYAKRGQRLGFASILIVAILVGFCVYEQAYWIAGVFGVIDFVAIAAVFGANQKPKER